MVNRVAPEGKEIDVALELAATLVESAPLVLKTLKGFVNRTLPRGPAELAALARDDLLAVRDSEDGAKTRIYGTLTTVMGGTPCRAPSTPRAPASTSLMPTCKNLPKSGFMVFHQ